ncbi:butyrate kinase [uncultured Cetobacterium sp.]|uniref:butyrate kinase n=1 Tax=uncultured Cetobacterium sp. TaxID=527638 RepID=UPI002614D5D1|nr:butyrate kinase [uncultured Cetobacterium sp.]
MEKFNILTINPGSTSTKISYFYEDGREIKEELHHESEELQKMNQEDEIEYRLSLINNSLNKNLVDMNKTHAVVGRGGLLKPLKSGTYSVNEEMLIDLKSGVYGKHASNYGGILAQKISLLYNIPAYIVDPVVVDEMSDIAKISGIPEIPRKSIFHALNQKAVAKVHCEKINKKYNESSLIVAHMGGGISVGLHYNGEVIDVNNALDGDGPFSPERSGGVPIGDFFKGFYNEEYSKDFLLKRIKGQGGIVGYLGTNNVKKIVEDIKAGNIEAKKIIDAMCYQIAKEIGGLSTILSGNIDNIILTGGMAYSDYIISKIKEKISFICEVIVIPGENEMLSLYHGGCRVLSKEESVKSY